MGRGVRWMVGVTFADTYGAGVAISAFLKAVTPLGGAMSWAEVILGPAITVGAGLLLFVAGYWVSHCRPRESGRSPMGDRFVPENPYGTPITHDDSSGIPRIPRASLSRGDASRILIGVGLLGGAALGSVGYILRISFIELMLVPPFKSPPNYGQFMFVVVGVAFYMTLFGVALAAVPYVRWYGYVPVHLAGVLAIWASDRQFFAEVDWNEAPIAAMLLLYALPTLGALAVDIGWRRRAADPASTAPWNPDESGRRAGQSPHHPA